jgi:hypothetical protein
MSQYIKRELCNIAKISPTVASRYSNSCTGGSISPEIMATSWDLCLSQSEKLNR